MQRQKREDAQERWQRDANSVFNISYHIIWCPKYRRKVLQEKVAERLKQLLIFKANALEIVIEKMEVMPDHVHLFIRSKPELAIHQVIGQLKGYSSRLLRTEFAHLRSRLPTLWTRSYYVETIGHISEETIKRYIEEQKAN